MCGLNLVNCILTLIRFGDAGPAWQRLDSTSAWTEET